MFDPQCYPDNFQYDLYHTLRFWCFRELAKIQTFFFKDDSEFHSFDTSFTLLGLVLKVVRQYYTLNFSTQTTYLSTTSKIISAFQEEGTFNPEKAHP